MLLFTQAHRLSFHTCTYIEQKHARAFHYLLSITCWWLSLSEVDFACFCLYLALGYIEWVAYLAGFIHFLALSSVLYHSFVKYFPNLASFCLLPSFSQFNDKYCTINIDGVLGIRTRDRRMAQTNPLSYGGALYSQTLHQKSWLYFCLAMQLCLINLVLWSHSFLLAILLLRYNLVFLFAKSGRYCYIF